MGAIDKTYVNLEQYKLARQFWIDTREQQIKELGSPIWLYPFEAFKIYDFEKITDEVLAEGKDLTYYPEDDITLWNTGIGEDLWLIKNCPLDFIQKTLKYQYGDDYYGFKYKDDFIFSGKHSCFLMEINDEKRDINLCLYGKIENDEINCHDRLIFYGTTFILSLINEAFKTLEGLHGIQETSSLEIQFEFYGIPIVFKNGKFHVMKTDEIIKIGGVREEEFHHPEIKHSYSLKEAKKYRDEEIYVSGENNCYDITQYIDFDRKMLDRYVMFGTPRYMYNFIKK